MSTIQILLAKSDSVLGLGVIRTLQAEEDFILVDTPINSDGSVNPDPQSFQPDVIILEIGANAASSSRLSHILQNYPDTAIITINSTKNWIKFVNDHETTIAAPAQLVAAIRAAKKTRGG